MTRQQRNTALAAAILAGVLSLPLTWMTIRGAQVQSPLGDMFNSAFGPMTVSITGLNGHVTFLAKTPIWLIVGVAIAASVLQLMRHSAAFAIPRAAEWLSAILAVAWVSIVIVLALLSDTASIGVGSLLGLLSAVIPLACLIVPTSARTASSESSANPPV